MKDVRPHEQADHLTIVWATADVLTAKNMVMVYGPNSLKEGWWGSVTVLVWGAAQKLLPSSQDLQEDVRMLEGLGATVKACKTCSDQMGITQDLLDLGLVVERVGKELTEALKGQGAVITV